MNNITMNAKDTLSAKLAECFITVNGNRYNFMQAINFEASFERTKTEVPILGKTGKGMYFFALITEEGFLISPCYSLDLCIQMGISFLFSFAFHFSSFHSYL